MNKVKNFSAKVTQGTKSDCLFLCLLWCCGKIIGLKCLVLVFTATATRTTGGRCRGATATLPRYILFVAALKVGFIPAATF